MKRRLPSTHIALALLCAGCAGAQPLPPRSPGLRETIESATGMLARAYPDWSMDAGPMPGRVVGLLMPAASRWGRSFEHIGGAVVREAIAYRGGEPERLRSYGLYAAGLSPRLVWFGTPAEGPAWDRAVRTLEGEERRYSATWIQPGPSRGWGLGAEAHIAAVEVNGGEGNARSGWYEIVATGVDVLDGQPGYPRSVVALLDAARATFDRFVAAEAPRVAALLAEAVADPDRGVAGDTSVDETAEGIFPYWDDERRRLVVLFYRTVTRMTRYTIACQLVYEGMPPETRFVPVRHGLGVELGQRMELDAEGVLVSLRSFEPALFTVASNAPDVGPPSKAWPVVCPGSPGLRDGSPASVIRPSSG